MRSRLFSRVVIGATLAAGLTLSGLPPVAFAAGPAAPGGLSPSGNTVGGQPLLIWNRVAGAVEYDVQVSGTDSFGSTLYSIRTQNRRATPTANLPSDADLFWRVRGVNSGGATGAWSTTSFSRNAEAGPQLQTPDDGAVLAQPDSPPLLTWDMIPGAISYSVEVDNDDLFIGPAISTAKNTAYLVTDPGPEQTYYWRVRANYDGGYQGGYSETRSFQIEALSAPVLREPDDSSSTQVRDAVLDWYPVPGAVKYEVRVSPDQEFNTIADSALVKSTRYARPTSLNNDQYWWQVRAIDVNDNKSPWTNSLNQFQRHWPDQPELLYPEDEGSVGRTLYYEWSPVSLASEYQLEVARDASFSPGTYDICKTKATTFTPQRTTTTDCSTLVEGDYYWRVRPLDGPNSPAINGIYSEIHEFTYDPGLVTQFPVTDNLVPTLRWERYTGAESYKVNVYDSGGSLEASTTTYATAWTPTGANRLDPEDGPFSWTVQALGADDFKSSTLLPFEQPTFSLDDEPFPSSGDALTPTSDSDSHSYGFPELTWEPDVGAAYYKIFVAKKNSNVYTALADKFPYPAGSDDSEKYLIAGEYKWFVTSYTINGTARSSGPLGTFTIDQLELVTGTTVSLTGTGIDDPDHSCSRRLDAPDGPELCNYLQQTPVFAWDRVDAAAYYMLYLYKDKELTNLASSSPTTLVTANRMFALTNQLPDSQAGTAYYWVIRPCKSAGACAPDPIEATNAFDKISNPVQGLEEREHDTDDALSSDGLPEFADEVVLSWDDYLNTNQQEPDRDVTGLPSTVEAKSYRVQTSTDPNFTASTTKTTSGIDQTSYTVYDRTLDEGPLYWRVQAVDGEGNLLTFSETRALEKRSPRPDLMSPLADTTVSTTPPLTWEPLAYAAKYEIQIAKDADTTFSASTTVIGVSNLEQATYVPTRTLDPVGSPYVWRVRRLDADLKPGAWSSIGRFSVKADAPTLVSPAADRRISGSDALFTWSGVAGAERYRFERRYEGSTSTTESVKTVGLNWAPRSVIPRGRYEWRVVALDADARTLGVTGWRNFLVDDDSPRVLLRSPSSSGPRKTNFTVTFDERVKGLSSATMRIYVKGHARKLSAKVTLTKQGTRATLNPSGTALKHRTYVIKLSSKITDIYGNKLKPYSWKVTIR